MMGGRRRLGLPLSPAEAVRRLGRARPRPLWSGPLYALTGGRTCHGLGGPRTPGPEERILIVAGKRTEKSRSFFLMPLPFTLSAHKCAGGGGTTFLADGTYMVFFLRLTIVQEPCQVVAHDCRGVVCAMRRDWLPALMMPLEISQ